MFVIGHRGAKSEAPENTIGGFLYALEKGVTHFELDVRLSADGVPVIIHDTTTRRTTGERRRVAQCTSRQMSSMNAASTNKNWPQREPVPRLIDIMPLLERCNSVQLELKPDDSSQHHALLSSIREVFRGSRTNHIVLTSFDSRLIALARKMLPNIHRGLVCKRRFANPLPLALQLECSLLVFHYRLLSEQLIRRIQRAGLEVSTYTTNDIRRIRQLREWGIDSIITDYPARYLHLEQPLVAEAIAA